jgi:hypothetical protein
VRDGVKRLVSSRAHGPEPAAPVGAAKTVRSRRAK